MWWCRSDSSQLGGGGNVRPLNDDLMFLGWRFRHDLQQHCICLLPLCWFTTTKPPFFLHFLCKHSSIIVTHLWIDMDDDNEEDYDDVDEMGYREIEIREQDRWVIHVSDTPQSFTHHFAYCCHRKGFFPLRTLPESWRKFFLVTPRSRKMQKRAFRNVFQSLFPLSRVRPVRSVNKKREKLSMGTTYCGECHVSIALMRSHWFVSFCWNCPSQLFTTMTWLCGWLDACLLYWQGNEYSWIWQVCGAT